MVGFIGPLIIPFIRKLGYRRLCQIGVSRGHDTDKLLALKGVSIVLIDPCIDEDLIQKYRPNVNVTVRRGLSLEILPKIKEGFDCILIDGDHNWYTVFHELQSIETNKLLNAGGAIFFHDVGWPYGRRDMYYVPESIPAEYRHPYARRDVVRGQSMLSDKEGGGCNNALHEYGPRNGVLTGIEDFLAQQNGEYQFVMFDVFHGLGLLVKGDQPRTRRAFLQWSLMAKCINPIMAGLQISRLENVIHKIRK